MTTERDDMAESTDFIAWMNEHPQSAATPPGAMRNLWRKPWMEAERRIQERLARLAKVFETGAMTRGCTEDSWRAAFKALKCLVETADEPRAHQTMQQDD